MYKSITRCCTFIHKKGLRNTFAPFTQNKSCLLQNCHLKLNQVNFFLVPPTQQVKSFAQNQNLKRISANPFKSNHKPLYHGLGMPQTIILTMILASQCFIESF
jgi:hypothetical protein